MKKNNVVLNIEETIRRTKGELVAHPAESAWMQPLLTDLESLLQERGMEPEADLDRELRAILTKHQPAAP
jgi:hypothetical protein